MERFRNLILAGLIGLLSLPGESFAEQYSPDFDEAIVKETRETKRILNHMVRNLDKKSRKVVMSNLNLMKSRYRKVKVLKDSNLASDEKARLIGEQIDALKAELPKIKNKLKRGAAPEAVEEIELADYHFDNLSKAANQYQVAQYVSPRFEDLRMKTTISDSSDDETEEIVKKTIEENSKRNFAGYNWGVGVSLTHDLGNNDRVEEATITDGVVRVTKQKNDIPRITLEAHKWFLFSDDEKWGLGPFAAIQPGSEDIIDAIGFGLMVGHRYSTAVTESFNIGIGAIVDPSTKILGDGFNANEAPPGNETVVRTKETDQWGLIALISFNFK